MDTREFMSTPTLWRPARGGLPAARQAGIAMTVAVDLSMFGTRVTIGTRSVPQADRPAERADPHEHRKRRPLSGCTRRIEPP